MILASGATEIWIVVGGVFGGISTLLAGLGLAWRVAHTVGEKLSDIGSSVASIEAKIEHMRNDLHSIETWGHDHERRLTQVEMRMQHGGEHREQQRSGVS